MLIVSQRLARGSSFLILLLIGGIAIGLSIASYEYSTFTSNKIREIAAQDIRSNAEIEAYDIANNINSKIDAVRSNLVLLSISTPIQSGDLENSKNLFSIAQQTTSNTTSSYFWIDREGTLLWANSFENETIFREYAGDDRSFRSYFHQPRDTLRPYFSTVIESIDGLPRLYLSHPINSERLENITNNDNNGSGSIFNGVVVSSIDLDEFGRVLESQLSDEYSSALGMLDRSGIILYSSNDSLIGKHIFGDEFQAILPTEIRDTFTSFLRDSLTGSSGSGEVTVQRNTSTVAYQPVSFGGDHYAVVYIIAPHNIQENVGSLIDQQRNFNLLIIVSIGIAALGIAYLILSWNRRLSATVKSKTSELEKLNSSLKEALEQLKVHDKIQQEFINVAAHELRTPIQAIIGYSELFYLRPQNREDAIKSIARNAERLERLTNDILDVTRIEGHRLDFNKERFNVSEVIESAIEDAKRGIDDSKIKFEYSPKKITIEADRNRIAQVIANILNNAIKFTKQGTIYISTSLEDKDRKVVISVKDTGAGIDPEIVPRLFAKFTSKSQTGTGLGLFISKSIIEAHDGKIWAENNKNGKGATFAFSLPIGI